jgi:hypothetical protein
VVSSGRSEIDSRVSAAEAKFLDSIKSKALENKALELEELEDASGFSATLTEPG